MSTKPFSFEEAQKPVDAAAAPTQPEPFSFEAATGEAPKRGFGGWARDVAATAVKGAIAVPEMVVGLADIPTGGRVGKFLENEGGAVGFRPKQAKEIVNEWHSDATKEAQRKFQEADGFWDKAATAVQNPSLIATAVGESIPSMLAGGVMGRGALAAARGLGFAATPAATAAGAALATKQATIAGAAGEGLAMAGSAAEQIRQETEDGLLTPMQSGAALLTGAAGGVISRLSGGLQNKLGIGDADTMAVQGLGRFASPGAAAVNPLVQQTAARSIPNQVVLGAINEGLLEELPQSLAEQMLQNVALGKPWHQDLDAAAIMGTLSGGVMGAGAAGLNAYRNSGAPAQADPNNPGQPGQPGQPDAEAAPQPSPGMQAMRAEYEARLADLQAQEQGEASVRQTNPPDGRAIIEAQQAIARAERGAAMAAGRTELGPDDEIHQSTGATDPVRQMVKQAADAGGALSSAAVVAIDTGAAGQMQQAADQAQAQAVAQEQAKAGKKADPAAKVDASTGEIAGGAMASWSDDQLSSAFRGAQDRKVRIQIANELQRRRTEREQADLQAELQDEQAAMAMPDLPDNAFASVSEDAGEAPADLFIDEPATRSPAPRKGNSNGTQATQAQQAEPKQPAQPANPPAAGPAFAGSARQGEAVGQPVPQPGALTNAAPTANNGAQAATAPGPQTQAGGEATAPAAATEALRTQLREVEDKILRAAPGAMAAGGGDIEAAMKSPKVPVTLKAQRKKLKDQMQAAQPAGESGDGIKLTPAQKREIEAGGTGFVGELGESARSSLQAMRNNPKVPVIKTDANGSYFNDELPQYTDIGSGFSVRGYSVRGDVVQDIKLPNGMVIQRKLKADGSVTGSAEGNYDQIVEGKGFAEAEKLVADYFAGRRPEAQTRALPAPKVEDGSTAVERDKNGYAKQFAPETGTLGIPRSEMPQVPTQSHGGLVKHLNAQGIAHETTTVDAASLKPTQAEYSPEKVEAAKSAQGDRAVIVSSDGHIIDGHHQAVAAAEQGKTVKAIVLDAPVEQALEAVKNSPSASQPATQETAAQPAPKKPSRSVLAKLKEQARAEHFAPGNVIASYGGGHDRVVSYQPSDEQGNWSVTVRAVQKQGDTWVDVPNERERTHSTQPDAKELTRGPVGKVEVVAASEPEMGAAPQAVSDDVAVNEPNSETAYADGQLLGAGDLLGYFDKVVASSEKGGRVANPRFLIGEVGQAAAKEIAKYIDGYDGQQRRLRVSGRTIKHIHESRPAIAREIVGQLPGMFTNPDEVLPDHKHAHQRALLVKGRNAPEGQSKPKSYVATVEVEIEVEVSDGFIDIVTIMTAPDRSLREARELKKNWPEGQQRTEQAVNSPHPLTSSKEANPAAEFPDARPVEPSVSQGHEDAQAINGVAGSRDDGGKLTQAEAKALMEWQDMGQTDGIKKHALHFYESQANKDANRGRMTLVNVTKDTSASNWFVEGDDKPFAMLGMAKKRAEELGMERAMRDGFVLADAVSTDVAPQAEFPLDEAASSYSGISHSGTQRAKSDAAEFEAYIERANAAGLALAETDEQKAAVEQATKSLRADYLAAYRRMMGVRADTYSGFVAGRSGLNAKQADQRNSAYDRAIDAFVSWQKENDSRVRRAALDARTDEAKQADIDAARAADDQKAQAKEDADLTLMRKILNWKKGGEPVAIGKAANLNGVNLDKAGYPSSVKLSPTEGSTLSDDKFDLAALFRRKGMSVPDSKRRVRELVDAVRAEDGAQVAAAKAEPAAKTEDSKTPTVDRHMEVMEGVRAGTATPEQFKASFNAVVDGKEAILAELDTKTKVELLRAGGAFLQMRYASERKSEVVEAFYRQLVGEYTLGEGVNYGMGKGSYEAAVRRMVEATDEAKLKSYLEERKAAVAEALARRAARVAAITNPQTLADFREVIGARISDGMSQQEAFLTLTPEQRIKYDTLAAESTRERREEIKRKAKTQVATAGNTSASEVIATKHTKLGHDLFVVKLADRVERDEYLTLNNSAKRLGGSYSSFRGNGAIPGFQFRNREAAEAFRNLVDGDTTQAEELAAQRRDAFEDDRSQTAVERLRAMAEKLEAQAEEEENRQRKTNTAKRARYASSAMAGAAADKAKAKTMRNIADAIEAGNAKFLDEVRTKTQVDMLTAIVATAKSNELRAKHPSYADQEKRRGEPPTAETADFAEFPSYASFRSDLASLARQMLEVEGTKKLGQRLMSVADDVTDTYLEFAKKNISKVSQFGRGDAMADFSNKDDAERAIRRSGLTGKAIVLTVKRGQHRVILSPGEAIGRKIWEGDGDKRITLNGKFGAELVEAIGRRGNKQNSLTVPWQFQNAYDRRKALSRLGIETASEYRSAVREFIALKEQAVVNRTKELELQMVGRKADGLDFFPTPAEVADQMVEAADLSPDMAVLEPSAGMGHLADRIREAGAEPDVIEASEERRELLLEKGYHMQGYTNFLAMEPRKFFTYGDLFRAPDGKEGTMRGVGSMGSQRVRLEDENGNRLGLYDRDELTGIGHRGTWSGYDRIIMNPPFSNRRDAEHVMHAYTLLKPGGRIVAIMGEGVFFGQDKKAQEFRDWLESVGGTSEKLPAGSFMDPSLPVTTGVSARLVVIDRPLGSASSSQGGVQSGNAVSKFIGNTADTSSGRQKIINAREVDQKLSLAVRNLNSALTKRLNDGVAGDAEFSPDLGATNAFSDEIRRLLNIPSGSSGGINADILQAARDGASIDAALFGNEIQGGAVRSKGFDSLNPEVKGLVQASVLASIHDRKVFDSVVELVPVDVMNDLIGEQFSPDSGLNDKTMLGSLILASRDMPVLFGRFVDSVAASTPLGMATAVAEKVGLLGDNMSVSLHRISAATAKHYGHEYLRESTDGEYDTNARMVVIDKPAGDLVLPSRDDAGAGVNAFRTTRAPGSTQAQLSLDAVKKTVESALRRVVGAPAVQVVARPEDIGLVNPFASVPKGATLNDGSVVVFSDGAESVVDVYRTVFHELFHRGSKVRFERNSDYITKMLTIAAGDETVRAEVASWKKSDDGLAKMSEFRANGPLTGERLANYEAIAVEEALATMAERIGMGELAQPQGVIKRIARFLARVADAWGMTQLSHWLRNQSTSETEKFVMETIAMSGGKANTFSTALLFNTSQSADTQELADLFKALEAPRGLKLTQAYRAVDQHPLSSKIREVESNFLDILERLDDAGLVQINC